MQKHVGILVILIALFAYHVAAQVTVYVAPDGDDANSGDIDKPFKTVAKGLTAIGANGTVFLRGGTFALGSSKLSLSKSGSATDAIKLWANPGETPVLDCSGNSSDGISISGSYYHLKGLDICKAGHNGINISGNNNIIENCRIHDNKNTGLHLTGSGTGPSNNLVLNCDASLNYDAPVGGNADGFSAKWTVGPGNVFRGCRSYNNSDDGWDLWMATGSVLIENCWAYRNGVDSWHSGSFSGNGNGFKLGGNNVATPHTVRHCVAFDNTCNGGKGFDENNNLAGQTLYNCTSFRNKNGNFIFNNTLSGAQKHIIKNCLSYSGSVSITNGTLEKNSWQSFTVSASDFRSVDTTGMTAPRNPDGTLPTNQFLRLANNSSLIDAGVDVGLPYAGKAPDLGAFEANMISAIREGSPFNSLSAMYNQKSTSSGTTLKIYDILGREISAFTQEMTPIDCQGMSWNKGPLPAGVHIAKFQAGTSSQRTPKLSLRTAGASKSAQAQVRPR